MSVPDRPVYVVSPKPQPLLPSMQPPDVAGALAAEEAVLAELKAHMDPRDWPKLLADLTSPPKEQGGIISSHRIGGTTDPRQSELITKFYEARSRTANEQMRQDAVDAARWRGSIPVVVTLGEPRNGALAELMRRPGNDPRDVIILAAGATPDVLGAALETLQQSRARNGDILPQHLTISDVRTVQVDTARQAHLANVMKALEKAEARLIKGVGTVKAITVRSDLKGA